MKVVFFRGKLLTVLFLVVVIVVVLYFEPLVYQFVNNKFVGTENEITRSSVTNTEIILETNETKSKLLSSDKIYKQQQNSSDGQQTISVHSNLNGTITWTILLTINNAFFDFYLNWLWHYQQLHLSPDISVIVVAEDNTVYQKLKALKTQKFTVRRSDMDPINSSLVFDTPLFKKYMARRAVYVLEYLQKGVDVLHVDVDSVWLKNPFPFLVGDYDIWGQVDRPADLICIGFLAFKTNAIVKKFVKLWIDKLESLAYKRSDQDVFNDLRSNKTDLKINKLPIYQFPSGQLYFERFDNVTRGKAVVVHNNWIIGHDQKRDRFKKFGLWKV